MSRRNIRLKTIRKIITNFRIPSQEQLLQKLADDGMKITQATLSRDLKTLKVGKVPDSAGGYYYVLSENDGETLQGYIEDFKRGYLSITFSQNMGVIKTLSGHADTVAIALDRIKFPEILGTIAGDDTILVILKEGTEKNAFLIRMEESMGKLETF